MLRFCLFLFARFVALLYIPIIIIIIIIINSVAAKPAKPMQAGQLGWAWFIQLNQALIGSTACQGKLGPARTCTDIPGKGLTESTKS